MGFFETYLDNLTKVILDAPAHELALVAERLRRCSEVGGKVILVGNGGSAAIASHVAVDLTKTAGVRAVNFNESSLVTCFANDYGYEHWVKEALHSFADDCDVLILISSSGESLNILNGALYASARGISVITLSGFALENSLSTLGDINLWVDSSEYNTVENTHQIWLLAISDYLVSC